MLYSEIYLTILRQTEVVRAYYYYGGGKWEENGEPLSLLIVTRLCRCLCALYKRT